MMRLMMWGTLVAAAAGCDLKEFTVSTTAPVIKNASKSFAAETDPQLAREAAPAQLKTADGFLVSAPANRILLEVVAQGYLEYAFGFLEDDLEAMPDDKQHQREREALTARATDLYDRALAFSLRLIATEDKHFGEAFKKDASATEAEAKKLDKESVPGLLFAGIALASSINLNRSNLDRVVDLPKAVALVKRAYELDPKFYNGGAAMTLGIVSCSQGKAMGGDPTQGRKYFDEAIAATNGKYLMSKVMMAKFCGVVTQDRALFESTLKSVLATPAGDFPEQRLANDLAKHRASRYLAHAEDYF